MKTNALFGRICRTCLGSSPKELYTVQTRCFPENLSGIANGILILDLLTTLVPNFEVCDEMPGSICELCLNDLIRVRNFLDRCEKSQAALKTLRDTARGAAAEQAEKQKYSGHEEEIVIVKIDEEAAVILDDDQEGDDDHDDAHDSSSPFEDEDPLNAEETPPRNILDRKRLPCPTCGMTFIHPKSLQRHIENFHGESRVLEEKDEKNKSVTETKADPDQSPLRKSTRTTTSRNDMSCDKCHAEFPTKKSLNRHVKTLPCVKTKLACCICKREFVRSAFLIEHFTTHTSIPTENPVSLFCSLCPERNFAHLQSLKEHMTGHRDDASAKNICEFCKKSFNRVATLKDHLRVHTKEKPFKCAIEGCGKAFSQSANLKQHLNRHNNVKNFKCSSCPAAFVTKGELDTHTRVHSGNQPFVCGECGQRFTTSSSMVRKTTKLLFATVKFQRPTLILSFS